MSHENIDDAKEWLHYADFEVYNNVIEPRDYESISNIYQKITKIQNLPKVLRGGMNVLY